MKTAPRPNIRRPQPEPSPYTEKERNALRALKEMGYWELDIEQRQLVDKILN